DAAIVTSPRDVSRLSERYDFDFFEFLAEEPRADLAKVRLVVRHYEDVFMVSVAREQPPGLELPRHDLRGLFGGIHQRHTRTHHAGEQRLQQRVVRAAEHQRLDAGTPQRLQVLAGDELGRRVIEPAFFHERHEQWAGPGVHAGIRSNRGDGPLVGAARNRARGPDHADRPRPGRLHRGARTGLDDADERHGRARLQVIERLGGDGVAGDDQGLYAALQQVGEDLRRVAAHGVRGLRAVGHARGVAEINDRLAWEALEQGARHGEPSDAGVEHAERRRVHRLGHRKTDADAVG